MDRTYSGSLLKNNMKEWFIGINDTLYVFYVQNNTKYEFSGPLLSSKTEKFGVFQLLLLIHITVPGSYLEVGELMKFPLEAK